MPFVGATFMVAVCRDVLQYAPTPEKEYLCITNVVLQFIARMEDLLPMWEELPSPDKI
jgi:hypothetical protein